MLFQCIFLLSLAALSSAQQCICLEEVAGTQGLRSPTALKGQGNGSGRLYVAEQIGYVWIIENGERLETPFLSLEDLVTSGGERGFLAFTFHPDYAINGRFFVFYSYVDDTHWSRVSEFLRDADNPDVIDTTTEKIIMDLEQPFTNHNGGDVSIRLVY